jgi:SAM-dependent methyltransferase
MELMTQNFASVVNAPTPLKCWCGGGTWTEVFREASFGLLRCGNCGSTQIDPPPVNSVLDLPGFYTKYYRDRSPAKPQVEASAVQGSRFWKVAELVPELKRVLGSALDVGCGEGTLCGELRNSGWARVTGVDMSTSRLARARILQPNVEFCDGLEKSSLEKGSVDLAVMDNVIEHVPDPVEQLQKIRRYLREGASLLMITPNMRSGNFQLLGRKWTQELAPHVHIFLFTPRWRATK